MKRGRGEERGRGGDGGDKGGEAPPIHISGYATENNYEYQS